MTQPKITPFAFLSRYPKPKTFFIGRPFFELSPLLVEQFRNAAKASKAEGKEPMFVVSLEMYETLLNAFRRSPVHRLLTWNGEDLFFESNLIRPL